MSAPRPEIAHWVTAAALLFVGLLLLAEVIVGPEVFRRRPWRAYAWPVTAVVGGVFLWLIAALSTFSTLHLIAHSLWAQAAMIAGGVQIAVIRGALSSPRWSLVTAAALFMTGTSFLVHEQNGWLFSRSAFLHHAVGWVLVVATLFPIGQAIRPRRALWSTGFAVTFVVVAVLLFADRDVAPIFGHLSEFAGGMGRDGGGARRCAAAVLAAAVSILALPAAAGAHATLARSTPPAQSSLDTAPSQIVLRFDQSVTAVDDAIRVLDAGGAVVSGPAVSADGGREIRAAIGDALPRGAYTVRWRALSSDGHVVSGVFTLGVGVAAPPPTEAVGAGGLTVWDDVARWGLFAALSLLLGPLTLLLVVLRGRDPGPRAQRAFYLTAAVGAFAALDVGIVAFVLRSENALQASFVDLLYADLTPFSEKTRFGVAFLVSLVGFGAVASFVILAWTFGRRALLWPALLGSIALASGFSLSGHQATEPNASWVGQLADWAHLVAAAVWAGGVLALAMIVWPLAPALRRVAFLGFSRIAVVLVAVLVLAGTYLSIVRLPDLADLWSTSYGRALLVKLAVVSLALAWGGVHHSVVRPRLERGAVPAGVGRSLVGESAVAMVVLLAAAVLVNGSPPPVESEPTSTTATAPG